MDYGRLSGKLHSMEEWLGMGSEERELLITAWSWAIDHEKDDGEIALTTLEALAGSLGHGSSLDYEPRDIVRSLAKWGWLDPGAEVGPDGFRTIYSFSRLWEQQAELIRKARERREKERERYLRRRKDARDG